MATRKHHPLNQPISCTPLHAPCPTCGKLGRRKQVLRRSVRTLHDRRVAFLQHAATLTMADHRRWTRDGSSDTLCIDELHQGHFTLLLATGPLRDRPVAFAPVDRNDAAHLRRFIQNLSNPPQPLATEPKPTKPPDRSKAA